MNKKEISVNSKYRVIVTFHNDSDKRLYKLVNNEDKTIIDSFNRDAFLIKANKVTKITGKIECLITSI